MNKTPRRYEKVDKHTIKLITENATNIDLGDLIKTRQLFIEKIEDLNVRLQNTNEIIAEAKKLGIIPKPKDKKILKTIATDKNKTTPTN